MLSRHSLREHLLSAGSCLCLSCSYRVILPPKKASVICTTRSTPTWICHFRRTLTYAFSGICWRVFRCILSLSPRLWCWRSSYLYPVIPCTTSIISLLAPPLSIHRWSRPHFLTCCNTAALSRRLHLSCSISSRLCLYHSADVSSPLTSFP